MPRVDIEDRFAEIDLGDLVWQMPERGRGNTHQVLEPAAEGSEAAIAHLHADFGDAGRRGEQHLLGAFKPEAGCEFSRWNTDNRFENAVEIIRAQATDLGIILQRERFGFTPHGRNNAFHHLQVVHHNIVGRWIYLYRHD